MRFSGFVGDEGRGRYGPDRKGSTTGFRES